MIRLKRGLIALCVCCCLGPNIRAAEDFCFIQISDTHIEPQPAGSGPLSSSGRSVSTIGWVCQQARETQRLEPAGITTPKPAFVACTGDLMEFGNVGVTFERFHGLFAALGMPLYLVPGNHDNTWAGMLQIMREQYGGDHYSFDRFGCHFVFFDSATPQEPTPSIEQRTLTFLKDDLRKVKPETPVFLFCHHPISSSEFAKPHEQLRFFETIQNHNVVALVMGHGHAPVSEKWGRLDSVMGGSTFGPHTGYSILFVQDNVLRVVYRFLDPAKGFKPLLEKSIKPTSMGLAFHCAVQSVSAGSPTLPVICTVPKGELREMTANVNSDAERNAALKPRGNDRRLGQIQIHGLMPGTHYVHVTARVGTQTLERTSTFDVLSPNLRPARGTLSAGMKARPIALGDDLLVATTAGELIRLTCLPPTTERPDVDRLKSDVLFAAGAEILHEPAISDDGAYVAAGNGKVFRLTPDGEPQWACDVGASVYGTPAIDASRVYVADLQGFVHAIDRSNGKKRWSKPISAYPIEQSMLLSGGVLYFSAWDGMVYAVSAEDGRLRWKSRCPAGHSSSKLANRYYAAGDASPLIIGQRIFVADRAYHLGSYALQGEYLGGVATGIAAIGVSEDGRHFYARGLESGLTKYDENGKAVWNNKLALGRFPIPPTAHTGRVYACSNRGLLSAVDAKTGETVWQYQATPQLHVMAPVGIDAAGRPCVAGMDGTVTCISIK